MKNILLVSSEFPPGPGGIGRHAADLSLALANKKFQVDVLASVDYVDKKSITHYIDNLREGIQVFPFKRMGWFTYINRIRVVLKQINKRSYDRIIVTGMFPLWLGALVKIIYRKKVHVDSFVHGSEVNLGNPVLRWITHYSLRKSDHIWAVSSFTSLLLPPFILKNRKVSILPNGIHTEEWEGFSNTIPYPDWIGYPKLLTVGNISNRKGQHRIIKALPAIIKTFPDVHYHMVGLPTNEAAIKNLAIKLGVSKNITVHGRLAGKYELARAYKSANIFVMLSENQVDGDVEGFGIAILEANYFGLPAIGAIGCGIEDAIQQGLNGYLVDGNSFSEITGAIGTLLKNDISNTSKLSNWIKHHDWNLLIEKFIDEK